MPPKASQPSKKTEAKRQEKVIEDKTFGLKNKNKSKVVQNYVKSVASQVKKLDGKGGEAKRIADEFALKAAQKKEEEKKALLNSLFKTVKKTQVEEDEEPEVEEVQDDRYEEIDLYTDQREQIFSRRGEGATEGDAELEKWNANKDKTDKICKFFLDAVEGAKYGWRWVCPNGMGCMYKHALPAGYTLKRDLGGDGEKDESTLEEKLERERILLTGSTPVTFERFMKWKEDKRIQREKEKEQKRLEELKKAGNKGGNVMSGRALFTYDPTLFQDDAEALDDEEYAEEIIEEQDEERKEEEPIDEEDEEEENEENGDEEKIEDPTADAEEKKKKKKSKKKKDDNVQINEDVFLDEGDVDLPDDDS